MDTTIDPAWVTEARKHIGTKEIKGAKHEPKILGWWKAIKRGGIKDDETPWCAAFVGGCLEAVGLRSSRFESAASYMSWGRELAAPVHGCIVVFTRKGGGHVGFVVGVDRSGMLLVLGGNQGDAVNVKAFPLDRVTGYRWPAAVPVPDSTLQVSAVEAQVSTNEA